MLQIGTIGKVQKNVNNRLLHCLNRALRFVHYEQSSIFFCFRVFDISHYLPTVTNIDNFWSAFYRIQRIIFTVNAPKSNIVLLYLKHFLNSVINGFSTDCKDQCKNLDSLDSYEILFFCTRKLNLPQLCLLPTILLDLLAIHCVNAVTCKTS